MTEIPEPDYDDDSEDDVADPVSGFYDDEPGEDAVPETGDVDADSDAGEQVDVEEDRDNDDVDESLDFDGVRAKLEAFSVCQQLRGPVSAADQGCRSPLRGRRLLLYVVDAFLVAAESNRPRRPGLAHSAVHALALARYTHNPCFTGRECSGVARNFQWRVLESVADAGVGARG